MPVAALQPSNRISPAYVYPKTGKVRIHVEASQTIDIFVASNAQADQINSFQTAANLGILSILNQQNIDQIFTLPNTWKDGWKLVIGNRSQNVIAVYYMVYDA
jgi:hypothetical protein